MSLQEFHDFANLTNALLWQGVAAVMAARISIAESRKVCEETASLLAARRDDRQFRQRARLARQRQAQRANAGPAVAVFRF